MREPLEKNIQYACVKHARDHGWDARKFGENGDPDYLFLGPEAQVFFVEFKRAQGRLTALQKKRIARIRSLGHIVMVIRGATGRDTFRKWFPKMPLEKLAESFVE